MWAARKYWLSVLFIQKRKESLFHHILHEFHLKKSVCKSSRDECHLNFVGISPLVKYVGKESCSSSLNNVVARNSEWRSSSMVLEHKGEAGQKPITAIGISYWRLHYILDRIWETTKAGCALPTLRNANSPVHRPAEWSSCRAQLLLRSHRPCLGNPQPLSSTVTTNNP